LDMSYLSFFLLVLSMVSFTYSLEHVCFA
jgi:hypothetical protein